MPKHGKDMRPLVKPKNVKATIKRIFSYLSGHKILFFFSILAIIISSLATIAGTYLLKDVYNIAFSLFTKGYTDNSPLWGVIIKMASIYIIGIIASYANVRGMVIISSKILSEIRCELFTAMQKLPVEFFHGHTHGDLMSLYTNDVDTLRELISDGVPQLCSTFVNVFGVLIMMIVLSPALTLFVLVMLVLVLFIIKSVGGKSGAYFKRQQQELGAVNGYIEEMIDGQKVVKAFCHEDAVNSEFDALNNTLFHSSANANTYASILMPIMGNLSYANFAITAAVGGVMLIFGIIGDIGSLGAFLQFTRTFFQPISRLSQQFNSILRAIAGAERIFNVLDIEKEGDTGDVIMVNAKKDENGSLTECTEEKNVKAWKVPDGEGKHILIELNGDVRFIDVSFGYTPDKETLKKVSLYAKPGQKIAFVGSTGAGKTTITNLINRFYDVNKGQILYDGIDIKRIKKDDLRHSLSMVLQDTHLFTGTVRENIRYGNLSATDEDVINAAKLANAHFFISHLPHGYDTVISNDGANLSQGQRQLISIARAAAANPSVLILDEATSSIDTRTEMLIEKGMDSLMKGRTVFVIAHRLSTVRNSNAIMVLEDGEIIERGDHEDLLNQKGKYYQLYTGKFELS